MAHRWCPGCKARWYVQTPAPETCPKCRVKFLPDKGDK